MYDRRTILAGTLGALAGLAGCQAPGSADSDTPSTSTTGDGATAATDSTTAAEVDYGGWFTDTSNFDGTVDRRGQSAVTVAVGAAGNGGAFAFDPPAVHVDPGTTVTWEWTGRRRPQRRRSGRLVPERRPRQRVGDDVRAHVRECRDDEVLLLAPRLAGDARRGGRRRPVGRGQ